MTEDRGNFRIADDKDKTYYYQNDRCKCRHSHVIVRFSVSFVRIHTAEAPFAVYHILLADALLYDMRKPKKDCLFCTIRQIMFCAKVQIIKFLKI